jgi:hypothetical protein
MIYTTNGSNYKANVTLMSYVTAANGFLIALQKLGISIHSDELSTYSLLKSRGII